MSDDDKAKQPAEYSGASKVIFASADRSIHDLTVKTLWCGRSRPMSSGKPSTPAATSN